MVDQTMAIPPAPTPVPTPVPSNVVPFPQPTPADPVNPIPTAAASGGFVGAIVILISLGLDHFNVHVPAEGTAALMVVLTPIVHFVAMRWGISAKS